MSPTHILRIFLSLAILLILSIQCTMQLASEIPANETPELAQDLVRQKTEIIFLVSGQLCREAWQGYEDNDKPKCKNLLPNDYYPFTMLLASPGSTTALDTNYIKIVNQGFHNTVCEGTFSSMIDIGSNCNKNIKIRQIENYSEYMVFRDSPERNLIVVKLKSPTVVDHWSIYLMYGTLGIIPGYSASFPRLEVTYFNSNGKASKAMGKKSPYLSRWTGWVFLFWGDVVTALNAPEAFSEQLRNIVPEAIKNSK